MLILSITKDISSEIFIIYGLIAIVVALIVVIAVLDKKEKKRIDMTRTQELKLMDLRKLENDYTEEYKIVEKEEKNLEDSIINVSDDVIKKIELETINIDDDMYVEDDLEKTSAQLRLEELTNELMKVQQTEEYKISKFEAEQEENAIISYKELLKVSAKLYDENDKIQYSDEGDEPITIEQLKNRFKNSNNNVETIEVL